MIRKNKKGKRNKKFRLGNKFQIFIYLVIFPKYGGYVWVQK